MNTEDGTLYEKNKHNQQKQGCEYPPTKVDNRYIRMAKYTQRY